MVKNAQVIRDKCKQIFEVGQLTANSLAAVVILQALHVDLKDIRRKHEDTTSPVDIIKSLEKEAVQVKEEKKKELAEAERANVAKPPPKKNSSKKKYEPCGNCGGRHWTKDCYEEGGDMEGRRDEVIAAKEERKKAYEARRNPASASTTPSNPNTSKSAPPTQGKAVPVKNVAGQTIYYQVVEEEIVNTAMTLTSNTELEEMYKTYGGQHRASSPSSSEYSMLANTPAKVSIDWREFTNPNYVDDPSIPIVALQTNKTTTMSVSPFYGDSGATTHITNA